MRWPSLAYGDSLENYCGLKTTGGSNPSLTAMFFGMELNIGLSEQFAKLGRVKPVWVRAPPIPPFFKKYWAISIVVTQKNDTLLSPVRFLYRLPFTIKSYEFIFTKINNLDHHFSWWLEPFIRRVDD